MIASIGQSDLSIVAGAVLGLAATLVVILRDTAGRLKRSGDPPANALTPFGWPAFGAGPTRHTT